ncbi:MAG: hypothetical protein LKI94_00265 [Sporolactobacillus sp.]|jgi:mannose/fructose-specific phosphotransferase system component IIA|nr:hypothetical protein [Sporolactobacillus sp.]
MARKIILVSHDGLAEGIKQAVEFIAGKQENILSLSMKSKGLEDYKKRFNLMMRRISVDDDLLLISDIPSGSPGTYGYALALKHTQKVTYLSGMNLPMVLELALSPDLGYEHALQSAKESIVNMGEVLTHSSSQDFDF